jgi:hypothetical protein
MCNPGRSLRAIQFQNGSSLRCLTLLALVPHVQIVSVAGRRHFAARLPGRAIRRRTYLLLGLLQLR